MKRQLVFSFFFLVIFVATGFDSMHIANIPANEIKVHILYSPASDWTAEAFIGTQSYGTCGPTYSNGVCGIATLPEGYYRVVITRYGCTAYLENVYHDGYGQTDIYFGPSSPEINCAK